jgi:hypothetical protein
MLFYASEKYPEEDSYSKYITEVYLFKCISEHMLGIQCNNVLYFSFLFHWTFNVIMCYIFLFFSSMEVPLMPVQVLRQPIFILILMLTILKRP